jgi:hypothetical protein
VNENFTTTAIEAALALAGYSVDLNVVRNMAAEGGTDVLPVVSDVRRATRAVSKNWWCSF